MAKTKNKINYVNKFKIFKWKWKRIYHQNYLKKISNTKLPNSILGILKDEK